MTDIPELKPCPFCGGEAHFVPFSFKTLCKKCGAHVPTGGPSSDVCNAAWNTRPAIPNEAELEAANHWQPIETAPRDGTEIIIYENDGEKGYLGAYVNGGWYVADVYPFEWTEIAEPTHWQPLPNPPASITP